MSINLLKKSLAALPRRSIKWVSEPTMDPRATDLLRPLIEKWKIAEHWTRRYRIMPRLVTEIFGDGRMLLRLYPTMFRPNHFVVRIDSGTDTSDADDWLDVIYEAIEEEFAEWPWASAYGFTWHEDPGADCDSRLRFQKEFDRLKREEHKIKYPNLRYGPPPLESLRTQESHPCACCGGMFRPTKAQVTRGNGLYCQKPDCRRAKLRKRAAA